jgi:flagellar protein FlbD
MIKVTRLNNDPLVVNVDLIEFLEATPETIICLTTGKKVMVRETIDQIIERVAEFKARAGVRVKSPDASASTDRS